MAEPNSDHVVAAPNVTGNNYNAADDGPLGIWKKARQAAVDTGKGWRFVEDVPDADAGGWHQV